MHILFLLENLKGRDHLVDLGVGGRIISESSRGIELVVVYWFYLAQDTDQWRAVVNRNIGYLKKVRNC
jgi:hypothetical protein